MLAACNTIMSYPSDIVSRFGVLLNLHINILTSYNCQGSVVPQAVVSRGIESLQLFLVMNAQLIHAYTTISQGLGGGELQATSGSLGQGLQSWFQRQAEIMTRIQLIAVNILSRYSALQPVA